MRKIIMDKIANCLKFCVQCSFCKSKRLDIDANFKIGTFNIFCKKCGQVGPNAGSPELARNIWNREKRIDKEKKMHPCLDCKDFISYKTIKIGKCRIYNKIIHKDKIMCKIKNKRK